MTPTRIAHTPSRTATYTAAPGVPARKCASHETVRSTRTGSPTRSVPCCPAWPKYTPKKAPAQPPHSGSENLRGNACFSTRQRSILSCGKRNLPVRSSRQGTVQRGHSLILVKVTPAISICPHVSSTHGASVRTTTFPRNEPIGYSSSPGRAPPCFPTNRAEARLTSSSGAKSAKRFWFPLNRATYSGRRSTFALATSGKTGGYASIARPCLLRIRP
mmetsp:Transcript_6963/g.17412  ORF Transcript_6963/g.17412 Transcript_6963/m.17412 type:complete len:217 (+) Transcript_6963:466-1116(+)